MQKVIILIPDATLNDDITPRVLSVPKGVQLEIRNYNISKYYRGSDLKKDEMGDRYQEIIFSSPEIPGE